MRILVVAGDPLARAGLVASLAVEPGLVIAAQIAPHDLDERTARAQVAVWDLGPRGAEPAAARDPGLEIPVLALVADAEGAATALTRGAAGVLRRDASPARLAAALRAIDAGLVVLDTETAASALRPRGAADGSDAEPLTPRELEVLQLLARGLANKEIAATLGISDHTAKFHVNAILAKLGAESRTEAVVRAARLGLVIL